MEENSGIKFHEAMTALACQWVGPASETIHHMTVVMPTGKALLEPSVMGVKNELKKETYPLPPTLEQAKTIVECFQQGAVRADNTVSDNVSQHAALDTTALESERWEGTEEEERAAYVTELCYIHAKLMVIDDRRVLVRVFFALGQ